MEKEQSYKDAANHYSLAWTLAETPSVGFRLSFNLLKSGNVTKAIEVGRQVEKRWNNYGNIRQDIIERAWGMLRS